MICTGGRNTQCSHVLLSSEGIIKLTEANKGDDGEISLDGYTLCAKKIQYRIVIKCCQLHIDSST